MYIRIFPIFLLGFLFSWDAQCQKFSKSWVGRAEAKTGISYNSYLCELDIKKKGNIIKGQLKYYFGKDIFLVPVSGTYLPGTKTIELNPFKLITFFAKDMNAPDCEMDGSLTLYIDGKDSVLYGQLNPVPKYKNFCPIMEISLRAEQIETEEFEEEYEVSEAINIQRVDSLVEYAKVVPAGKETRLVIATQPKEKIDSLLFRTFTQGPLLLVSSDTISLSLYDNGRVDNDTISVFFNRQLVVSNMHLSLKPLGLTLILQPGMNEIALFAENLGELPPNTALCIVVSGGERFNINLSSTLSSNGTVRIKKRE